MIIVTGAYGFIGSCLVAYLLDKTEEDILAVDDFYNLKKEKNLNRQDRLVRVERDTLFDYLQETESSISVFLHMGARTDTVETREHIFNTLNLDYSKRVWNYCTDREIPLIYASSAATYGRGEIGFSDSQALIPRLAPLNVYGWSKQNFDLWVLSRKYAPPKWVGLKFFNVYGPNEYHKSRMASVIFHAFHQINATGRMKLFRSHNPEYQDGEQLRDFIYIKDILATIDWMMNHALYSGIYNLGTGKARTFKDLTMATFAAMNLNPRIDYIDTPLDIRDNYQYYTQAEMEKLHGQGYELQFHSLEEGINDYVKNYLLPEKYFG